DPPRDRQIARETTSGGAAPQVSGAGLRGDFKDFAMLGERAEIAAVPGVRNAASGTSPPRSKRQASVKGRADALRLQMLGCLRQGSRGWARKGRTSRVVGGWKIGLCRTWTGA